MMKKIYYLLAATVITTVFSACSLKEDPVFDKSASLRSDENIEAVRTVLQSATNGWLMEYYGGLSFGGYNLVLMAKSLPPPVTSSWSSQWVLFCRSTNTMLPSIIIQCLTTLTTPMK